MKTEFVDLLRKIVAINSINPAFEGGVGEAEIAGYIHQFLMELGIDSELQTVAEGRNNVVAKIAGRDGSRSLLLNAHIDTVSVTNMPRPFELRQDGDRLAGRGAYDMKGSAMIMMKLAEYFKENRPPLDIWLTFVADEEDKSLGMDFIADQWLPQLPVKPLAGIFLEPTEGEIAICHKGFSWMEVNIGGKAAHGSRPERGIDAILPLHAGLKMLDDINRELASKPPDPLLGCASLHGGIISGGSGLSIIPETATLQWERRTLPGESEALLQQELQRVVAAIEALPGGHTVEGRQLFSRPPHTIDAGADIVQRMAAVAPEAGIVGVSFWADSAIGGAAGIPSIIYGPTGYGAHGVDEWISLDSLVEVYGKLIALIEGFAD